MVTLMTHTLVQHDVFTEYVDWLKNEHIPEHLELPGFLDAELCFRKGGSMESSGKEVKMVFHIRDEEHLKLYISEYAMKLREKGLEKFPGKFSAQREVWLESINFQSKLSQGL